VHVQPRSGRNEVRGRHGDALRCRVTAPPVDGKATEAARRLLAGAFEISPSAVVLVSGERSREKRFRLVGLDRNAALGRLVVLLASGRDG
jgi:uncharacterized protein